MIENKEKTIKYIFVDMDGVLADFLTGCEKYIGHPMTNDAKGHSDYDLRKEELTNKRTHKPLQRHFLSDLRKDRQTLHFTIANSWHDRCKHSKSQKQIIPVKNPNRGFF